MVYVEDEIAWDAMVRLSACLCTTIAERGLPEPCKCGPVPGPMAILDMCGACRSSGSNCGGQAWVRFVTEFPSTTFPSPDQTEAKCSSPMAYTLEVGIARCLPMPQSNGVRGYVPTTLDQDLEATRLQMADKAAIRAAIACCFGTSADDITYTLGGYTPLQNTGDCGGGVWTVTIWSV